MSETNWGNRLKDIADEVKTIGASVDELNQAFCALSEVLREVVQDALDDIASMQKDMAEDFVITNVVERLKEFTVHPARGNGARTHPTGRGFTHRNPAPGNPIGTGYGATRKGGGNPIDRAVNR